MPDMYVLTVAARHIRKRSIAWVAMALIAVIVLIYLLILSVLEGMKDHYMETLQSILAHTTINVDDLASGIQRPEQWAGEVAAVDPAGIKGVTISLEVPAMALFDQGQTVGTMRGVDLERELAFGRLKTMLTPPGLTEFGTHTQGGKPLQGCIVGAAWRKAYQLKLGDRMTFLFSDGGDDSEGLGNARSRAFAIVGFFECQNPYLERAAYVDRQVVAKMMRVEGQAKTLSVWMKDPNRPDLEEVAARIRTKMTEILRRDSPTYDYVPLLRVETWHDKEGKLYHAITRENVMMRFIMAVFLALIAFIIFLIFGRLVAEKVRDIGALRALGATPAGIRNCFLVQGLFIGVSGLALGLLGSYFFISYVNPIALFFGVDPFPADSFGLNHIPTHTLPSDVLMISGLTIVSAVLGALLPAERAARMNPVECLRHE